MVQPILQPKSLLGKRKQSPPASKGAASGNAGAGGRGEGLVAHPGGCLPFTLLQTLLRGGDSFQPGRYQHSPPRRFKRSGAEEVGGSGTADQQSSPNRWLQSTGVKEARNAQEAEHYKFTLLKRDRAT